MLRLSQKTQIEPYLSDASRFSGHAEGVILPESEKEISEFLKEANQARIPVTLSGGKTGLAGAAVPLGGWVLSTEKLSRILELRKDPARLDSWIRVEAGLPLKDLQEALQKEPVFFPPDPTGRKAFLGGNLATNASGPNSFKYGAIRPYVRRLRMVCATGEVLDLRRGQIFADREGKVEIPLGEGKLCFSLPTYLMRPVKQVAGYFAAPGMDAMDLFIGSEGTLGVVTEMELTLLPRPPQILAFMVFFRSEEDSWRLAKKVRELSQRNRKAASPRGLEARALEYFDSHSLEFLRPTFPSLPKEAGACLFIEQEAQPKTTKPLSEEWHSLFEKEGALGEVWEGDLPERQEEFREIRRRLPLVVNDFIARHGQMKIGTDTSVPDEQFEALMLFHRHRVEEAGLQSVTFGHMGESHVHLNLLPRNVQDNEKARLLYRELLQKAMALGGTFSGEHGVGKLRRPYLVELYGEKAIQEMRAVKQRFDPNLLLGRGNLFEIE